MQKQSCWSLFNRPDTLLGVCEGVGQDFGFNPNYLRVLLAVAMIWNPKAVLATYALLGIGVAVSRWIAPRPVPAAPRMAVVPSEGHNDAAEEERIAEAA